MAILMNGGILPRGAASLVCILMENEFQFREIRPKACSFGRHLRLRFQNLLNVGAAVGVSISLPILLRPSKWPLLMSLWPVWMV